MVPSQQITLILGFKGTWHTPPTSFTTISLFCLGSIYISSLANFFSFLSFNFSLSPILPINTRMWLNVSHFKWKAVTCHFYMTVLSSQMKEVLTLSGNFPNICTLAECHMILGFLEFMQLQRQTSSITITNCSILGL